MEYTTKHNKYSKHDFLRKKLEPNFGAMKISFAWNHELCFC